MPHLLTNRMQSVVSLLLALRIDPRAQEPGIIDVCNVAELQRWSHVSGRIRIDVVEGTISHPGHINGLLDEIYPVRVSGIYTTCAYQLGLVRKGQGPSFVIVGKNVMSISCEIAFRVIEDRQGFLLAVLPG